MKFYIATKKHDFLEVEGEPFQYNEVECFIHQNDDSTYNVSLVHLGYALVSNYYNKDEAIKEIRRLIDKHKNKIKAEIDKAKHGGYLVPKHQ